MNTDYIVQGHRYNIFEEVGCFPFTYNTPPAYLLVWMVPIPIGLTSGAYSSKYLSTPNPCIILLISLSYEHHRFPQEAC